MSRRSGFTLLEIMLALLIGLLLISTAAPGVAGLLREQKLKRTFAEFDDFVRRAQTKAVTERKTMVMVWEATGITLQPVETGGAETEEELDRFAFVEGAEWTLQRPAALVKKPVLEWPFWPSGLCEPVIVGYHGAEGSWAVEFNPLTGRGKFLDSTVQ